MKIIESLDKWGELFIKLASNGYQIWQMQYDTHAPGGFHVWFWASGKTEIEIVTYSDDVYNAIVKYRLH